MNTRPAQPRALSTLCHGSQSALLFGAQLQHGVDDRKEPLPLAAGFQEDELQQNVLQVLQAGHGLLTLLISFQSSDFTFEKLVSENEL